MQISRHNFSDEILARIRLRVRGESALTRTALSREVCEWMDWRDTTGRLRDVSCRVALLNLSRRGLIELPAAREVTFTKPAAQTAPEARDWLMLESTLAELGRVWLEPVDGSKLEASKQWWEMMRAHHPQADAPLCGAQLRYKVAGLGGFLGRKSDGEPGTQTLWLGLQRLDDIVAMWRVMAYATQITVSRSAGSG